MGKQKLNKPARVPDVFGKPSPNGKCRDLMLRQPEILEAPANRRLAHDEAKRKEEELLIPRERECRMEKYHCIEPPEVDWMEEKWINRRPALLERTKPLTVDVLLAHLPHEAPFGSACHR